MITRQRCVQALTEISRLPTAPFFEARVAAYIRSELTRLGLSYQTDEYGNIIAPYEGENAPERSLILVAHMDHPGFEVASVEGKKAQGLQLGGAKKESFNRIVPVRVFAAKPPESGPDEGVGSRIVGCEETDDPRRLRFHLELDAEAPDAVFGMWDLPVIEIRDDVAHVRAADDIASCAVILLVLETLIERKAPCRCMGVFTRAEEVGMVGATLLAEQRLLPLDSVLVSLETSKALPGAEIGAGPVIRVGDARNTFDNDAEAVLRNAGKSLTDENAEFKFQRQLMSGGACEAGMFILRGYRTTAMALPLGNYHNLGPDDVVSPEYIHLGDFAGEAELLVRAAEIVHADGTEEESQRYRSRVEEFGERLRGGFDD